MGWALGAQAFRDAEAVDRVDPLEVLRDVARLVALQLTDEMPGERQVGEPGDLCDAFLHIVLAKIMLPCVRGATHQCRWLLLADRQQPHRRGIAPGHFGGIGDTFQHRLQCVG